MKLGDLLIGVLAWCALVAMATLFVAFLNRPPQPKLEIANTASGAWDFNNAEAPRDAQGRQIRVFATCPWTPWALPKNEGLSKT
jgi:hypothetical protein